MRIPLCVGAKNLSPLPRCRRIERLKGEGENLHRTGSGGERPATVGFTRGAGATSRSPLRRRGGLGRGGYHPKWPSRATWGSAPPPCMVRAPSTLRSTHVLRRRTGERFFAPTQEGRAQGRRLPAAVSVKGDLGCDPAGLRGAFALDAQIDPRARLDPPAQAVGRSEGDRCFFIHQPGQLLPADAQPPRALGNRPAPGGSGSPPVSALRGAPDSSSPWCASLSESPHHRRRTEWGRGLSARGAPVP